MPNPKPPYPAAFRQQIVELVRAGGGISDLAREFGCNASSIHAWMKAAGGLDGSGATGIDAPLSMNERQGVLTPTENYPCKRAGADSKLTRVLD